MSYDEEPIENLLSRLRGAEKAAIHGGRQAAVESISTVLSLVEREMQLLKVAEGGLIKAREASKVANVDQLEQILEAVKVIVTTLRGRDR